MIIAIDVHYRDTFAKSVSIEFNDWTDPLPSKINELKIKEVEPYIPGQFYLRELPCILEVLKCSDLTKVDAIIVDGYVFLDDQQKKGLGAYLYEALDGKIPIIGVAKKSFHTIDKATIAVTRGASKNPLYVTSVGMDLKTAADWIRNMHGPYRFPDLLKVLDQHTKS